MAKVEIRVEKAEPGAEPNPWLDTLHKVLVAGVGALALTQEEAEKFVKKLIERGEIAEKDGKKLVQQAMERRKKEATKAEEQFDKRIEDVLGRLNVPSKADIEALSDKIAALSKKVDELKQG